LRQRRKQKQELQNNNDKTGIAVGGTTSGVDGDVDGDTTSKDMLKNQQQQQQQRHWLGPLIPTKWSWVFFESPCCIWVIICLWDYYSHYYYHPNHQQNLPIYNQILLGWFFFHYLYRSIWYPLIMMRAATTTTTTTTTTKSNDSQKKSGGMPLGVVLIAWSYCSVNGYLQSRNLTKFRIPVFSSAEEHNYQFWFGISWMVIGFYITVTSDRILWKLKQKQQMKLMLLLSSRQ